MQDKRQLIMIRPARETDAALMAELIESHFDSLINDPDQPGADEFLQTLSVDAFQQRLKSSNYRYTVAEDAGVMAGFAAIKDQSHLYHLFVAKTHQGQSVGRRLWEEQAAFSRGNGNSTGFSVNSSPAAQVVYEKFGFKVTTGPVAEHGVIFIPMQLQLAAQDE